MDTEVFDNVCAPSFAEGGLGSRLDDSTDFFERTRDDKPKIIDEVVCLTLPNDAFNVSPKKAPLANIPINSPVISETSKNETCNTKPESTFSIPTNISNPADGSELENLGRLAMFGNRPQQKRRSQLRREERSKVESERRVPIPRPEQSAASKVCIPAPVPRDPSNARQSYSRSQTQNRTMTSRLSSSTTLSSARSSNTSRQPSTIRSRTPSVEPIRSRRSASVEHRHAPNSISKATPPVVPRPVITGPITRSRARLSSETTETSNSTASMSLNNRLSQLQISSRPIAPLTSEQEFRKGIRQRNAIAPRLSSTPVGKVTSKLQEAITSVSKKPPLPSIVRREGSVTRDRQMNAVKQSPVIVARSPLRRTPVVTTAQPRVAFGSGVRPARIARRSNTSSPGFRKYPVNASTKPLIVTIPDTPTFMRRLSATKKDHPAIHAQTPTHTQPMQRQSSVRRSRIDVAQLVDRLSKPKVLASPKRIPAPKSKLVNGSTHGLTSQRKVRSRSTSVVRPGSANNAPETNQPANTKV